MTIANAGANAPVQDDHSRTPATASALASGPALVAAAAILLGLAGGAYALGLHGETRLAISVVFGAIFGVTLQRSRFCFFCMFRDWYDRRDPRGLYGLIVALAVGIAGYTVVFGAWLPDATTGRLPPDAFIGPVSIALVAAGLVFGAGMAVSGSCVSAHLYRLGEGSPTAPFALVGTAVGFAAGYASWNDLYLTVIADTPTVWLPRWLGYSGALVAALSVLGLIAVLLKQTSKPYPAEPAEIADTATRWLVTRWPAWIGGAIIGMLGTAAYFRVAPLGVTAEIAGLAKRAASQTGVAPDRLPGLDTLRGCVSVARDTLLSPNGAFVVALVAASFAAALAARQFKPVTPQRGHIVRGLAGGVLLGWGAMTALGCTVGTLLSGIMAGALSGWVFGAAVFAGSAVTLRIGRRAGLLPLP